MVLKVFKYITIDFYFPVNFGSLIFFIYCFSTNACLIFHQDQNEASYPSLTKPDDNETNSNTSEVDIDENDAYQLSLRKLLEKSMSMDNTSDQIHFPNTSKLVKNPGLLFFYFLVGCFCQ